MVGFYLIGYALGYLLLAIVTSYMVVKLAGKRGASKRGKIIAALVTLFIFWLILFWDWLPTVIYHNYLCRTDAGVKIYRSVEGVEGFNGGGTWALNLGYKYGYDFEQDGGFTRYRKKPSPSAEKPWKTWIQEASSEPPIYGIKFEQTELSYMNEVKRQHVIYILSTGEILATLTDFYVSTTYPYGSLYELRKVLWPFSRPCLWGGDTEVRLQREMVLKTLKPLEAKN